MNIIWNFNEVKEEKNDSLSVDIMEFANKVVETDIGYFVKTLDLDPRYVDLISDHYLPFTFHSTQIPFVAGGYLRRWVQKENFDRLDCDIDTYMNDFVYADNIKDKFVNYLKTLGAKVKQDKKGFKNHILLLEIDNREYEIQVMNGIFNIPVCATHSGPAYTPELSASDHYKLTIANQLETYDSFCSMCLLDVAKQKVLFHEKFISHAIDKVYEFNKKCRSVSPISQLNRIKKFTKEGYYFTTGSDKDFLEWVINNQQKIYDYNDAYNQ